MPPLHSGPHQPRSLTHHPHQIPAIPPRPAVSFNTSMSSEVKRAHRGIAKKVVYNSYGGTANNTKQAVSSAPKDYHQTVSAEAAPNTSTGSAEQAFASVCSTVTTHCQRPRKSCVPQSRPFKEEESRPETVPVSSRLALRAASTSLVSSAYVHKARQGPLVHSKHEGSGTVAHGDHDGLVVPR
jgi:hypothetical protein